MQTVVNNVDGAIDFIINAEKEHPNRIDTCRASTSGPLSTSNPLSQGGRGNPFSSTQGQNNPFGASSQPTAASAFGAPSTTAQGGAFGQPSALGQKPSAFGGPTPAFGAPSQLGAAGGFGRPSALGQKPNLFGAPAAGPSSGTSSGAPAPFSSFAGAGNPFSQPQQQQTANPFGAPSNPPIASGFPASSSQQNQFSQTSVQASNPFGSPNPPAQQNPFGPAPTPFGAPAPTPPNPFGQPSTKAPTTSANPFSNASTTTANTFVQTHTTIAANPFNNVQQSSTTGSPMETGGPTQPLVNGNVLLGPNGSVPHPPLETYSTKGIDGRLTMFKGMRVSYRDGEAGFNGRDGSWQKIWFPHGAPAPYKDTEMDDSKYDDNIKASYTHLHQSRSFQGGIMPMIPPRREWCTFDF
jgi:nucleoporin NUP42